MMSLKEVYRQSLKDYDAITLDGFGVYARISNGIKISMDSTNMRVRIYNTQMGGDNYVEISSSEYELFRRLGWKKGVIKVSMNSYMRRILKLEHKIATEIKRNNEREIRNAELLINELRTRYLKLEKSYNLIV